MGLPVMGDRASVIISVRRISSGISDSFVSVFVDVTGMDCAIAFPFGPTIVSPINRGAIAKPVTFQTVRLSRLRLVR